MTAFGDSVSKNEDASKIERHRIAGFRDSWKIFSGPESEPHGVDPLLLSRSASQQSQKPIWDSCMPSTCFLLHVDHRKGCETTR